MPETPRRPNAEIERPGVRGPHLRRELAQAAAAVAAVDLDISEAVAGESFELWIARSRDRGKPYSIPELHIMAEHGEGFPPPGREALATLERIAERCRIRRELDLPREPCAKPEGTVCSCQTEALDELIEGGVKPTRRRVAQLARKHHCSRGTPYVAAPPAAKPTPPPQEPPAPAQEPNEDVSEAAPEPPPQPEPTRKPEPPVRVVRRTPKWFDPPSYRRFSDMQF
jgi:hypothetical protein